jgi:hypothetical protein
VAIYFTAVGMIDVPTENQILAMMDEMKSTQNIKKSRIMAKVQPLSRLHQCSI